MPKYRVKVIRTTKVKEKGYLLIEADDKSSAAELAAEQDDPNDMTIIGSTVENWECEVLETTDDLSDEDLQNAEEIPTFINYYHCDNCNLDWDNIFSSAAHNDRCTICNREAGPYNSRVFDLKSDTPV